jgi:hypothetical protein
MTKIYGTAYPIVTDAECVARGASVHHVSVAEFCTLKIVSEVVVAQAKRKFRTMVHELPSGSPITLEIMHAWAEANFRQYRWEDVVINACMSEATKLAGEGVLRPVSPLFDKTGLQIHDNYTRA